MNQQRIFVTDQFEENITEFRRIRDIEKVYIIGPKALISILVDGMKIPPGIFHINSFTMCNCVVSASNLTVEREVNIATLVSYMGGKYSPEMKKQSTHLVCDRAMSSKYESAMKAGKVKVLHSNWIFELWKNSQKNNSITPENSYEYYKLPIFYKLKITSIGMDNEENRWLEKIITKHGGVYYLNCDDDDAEIVLIKKRADENIVKMSTSEAKKVCVTLDWICESLKAGFSFNTWRFRSHNPFAKNCIASVKAEAKSKIFWFSGMNEQVSLNMPIARVILFIIVLIASFDRL